MHFSPHPTPPGRNQPTVPVRITPGPGDRAATGIVGLVVFLPCQNPCCEPRPQGPRNSSTPPPADAVRGASDAEPVARAARPHTAKTLRLPRP
ncbi:hypothetical protein ACGF3G_17085 [Streptomyces sp. NPDC048179]|uniref:hypothetical protein n=1 Tax=Streptomyces sp. NPDC048179 TaxID=3365506 RepID=UPI0037137917